MKQPAISKSQKRLFILLAIIASYAVYDLATAKPRPAKSVAETAAQATGAQTEAVSAIVAAIAQPAVQMSLLVSDWRRDPFRKQAEKMTAYNLNKVVETLLVPKLGNLHLTAISKSGNKSYALINDQILTQGEVMNGYKIVDIQATQVILKKNDFSFTLTLPEEDYGK
jgi:hypothetical protein